MKKPPHITIVNTDPPEEMFLEVYAPRLRAAHPLGISFYDIITHCLAPIDDRVLKPQQEGEPVCVTNTRRILHIPVSGPTPIVHFWAGQTGIFPFWMKSGAIICNDPLQVPLNHPRRKEILLWLRKAMRIESEIQKTYQTIHKLTLSGVAPARWPALRAAFRLSLQFASKRRTGHTAVLNSEEVKHVEHQLAAAIMLPEKSVTEWMGHR